MKTIYIFKGKTTNLIKVGVTNNVAVRAYSISINEKEEIEILATYQTPYYKQIEACAKWHFSALNVPRYSKREWFNLIDIEMINFVDKALKAIELEPEHAPRWMDRYIKDRRNLNKDIKIWFM